MKFGLRDMLLAFSLVAILTVMLSGSHHQQTMGRHLLYVLSVIPPAIFFGWLGRPKSAGGRRQDWRYLRLRCAIGGLIGAVLYTASVWLLRERIITTPPFTHAFDFGSNTPYWYKVFWWEAICLLPLSLALGATVAPLFILCRLELEVDLAEQDQRSRNTSLVLLGLVILSWLLAAIDGWQRSYLNSHWLKIMAILIPIMVLFTFWWIEKVFRSINHSMATEPVISQKMPDGDVAPRSLEKQD